MENQNKSLTEILGFYFMVFQHDPRSSYVKCFFDGETQARYYKMDEIIEFGNKKGFEPKLTTSFKNAFSMTGLFLWDVENKKIKKLSAKGHERGMSKEMFETMRNEKPLTHSLDAGWSGPVNFDGSELKINF